MKLPQPFGRGGMRVGGTTVVAVNHLTHKLHEMLRMQASEIAYTNTYLENVNYVDNSNVHAHAN